MKLKLFFAGAMFVLMTRCAFAADTNAVLDGWLAAQAHLTNWHADFTQTRQLKTLVRPLTATGHVWFSAPGNFRWELREPSQTIALRQGDGMVVVYPQLKRAERYVLNADAPAEWRDALSLLEAGFPRNRQELDARFHIRELTETNGVWLLDMMPTSAFVRRMMTGIRIGLAKDYSLVSTELVFIDGSRMRNDFTNGVMNSKFDSALFEWKAPADYKVTEPFAK